MLAECFAALVPVAIDGLPVREVRELLRGSRVEKDAAVVGPETDARQTRRRWFLFCGVIFQFTCVQACMILALGDWVLAIFNHCTIPENWKMVVV